MRVRVSALLWCCTVLCNGCVVLCYERTPGEYTGSNDAFEFDWSEGGPMDLAPELKLLGQEKAEEQQQQQEEEVVMPPAPPSAS